MRIGINGFGRIGRLVFRALWGRPGIELVHVNDPAGDAATAAHLLEFDSVHGRWDRGITSSADGFSVEGSALTWSSEKDPTAVPWSDRGVEMVLEASGKIKTPETLNPYFDQLGLKRVVVACPVKGVVAGEDALNIVYGINHHLYEPARHKLVTAASCTTNCLAPVASVLQATCGINQGFMTTVHAYTGDQPTLDTSHKDLRRARAAAMSMIPTSTGAARSVGEVLPHLKGKMNGSAIRVPTANVSVVDFGFTAERDTGTDEINALLRAAAEGPMKGVLSVNDRPLVSVDFNHDPNSSIADLTQTHVMNNRLVRVLAWYDNEWGFSCRMLDNAAEIGKTL